MTVSEQRFMEVVPGTLRRIAEALEGINEKLEMLTQRREEPSEEFVAATEEPVTFEEVEDVVSSARISNRQTRRAITDALYFREPYVGKDCAANLSRFYGGVTVKQTQDAIDSGEIEAIMPEMREMEMSHWIKATNRFEKIKVKKPSSKYQVSLKSTILWLERNGRRGVAESNAVYKCIDAIINQNV